jgi:energy-coupling factor transporter transmembrane protein EcfT
LNLDLYNGRDTAIHRLHPAVKLLALGLGIALTFLGLAPGFQALIAAVVVVLALLARSLRDILRPWRLLLFILVFTTLIWCVAGDAARAVFAGDGARRSFPLPRQPVHWAQVSVKGQRADAQVQGDGVLLASPPPAGARVVIRFEGGPTVLKLGAVRVTLAELRSAIGYAFRVTTIVLLGLLFLATTRIEETIAALRAVGVPYVLAFTLGLAFRLVPLFLSSAASILEAQRSRGLDLESGSLRTRLRKYVPVLVPIFMTSLRSSDRMAMALEARGFGSGSRRTSYRRYPFGLAEVVAIVVLAGIGAAFYLLARDGLASIDRPM